MYILIFTVLSIVVFRFLGKARGALAMPPPLDTSGTAIGEDDHSNCSLNKIQALIIKITYIMQCVSSAIISIDLNSRLISIMGGHSDIHEVIDLINLFSDM